MFLIGFPWYQISFRAPDSCHNTEIIPIIRRTLLCPCHNNPFLGLCRGQEAGVWWHLWRPAVCIPVRLHGKDVLLLHLRRTHRWAALVRDIFRLRERPAVLFLYWEEWWDSGKGMKTCAWPFSLVLSIYGADVVLLSQLPPPMYFPPLTLKSP